MQVRILDFQGNCHGAPLVLQVRILDFKGNCHGAPLVLNKVPCTGLSTVIKQASKQIKQLCLPPFPNFLAA